MQINGPQFFFGRSQAESQSPRTFPVRSASPSLALDVGAVLSGKVSSTGAQTLVITLANGEFLELAGNSSLKEGESVTARVAATQPQLQVSVVRAPNAGEVHAQDLGLKSGQTLVATVVESFPDGRALVDLNGQQVMIEATGVEAGSLLPVRIDEEAGRVFLTVLGGAKSLELLAAFYLREQQRPRESLGRLLQALVLAIQTFAGELPEAQAPGEQLRSLLQSLLPGEEGVVPNLERGIEDSGLLMESRLAALLNDRQSQSMSLDVKALLLQLAQIGDLPDADPALKSLTLQALRQLEQLQLANVLNQLNESAFLWQLPGWPGSSPVYLRIEPDAESFRREDDDSRPAWQVLMAVDLDDVGPVRIDARLDQRNLRVLLYVAPEQADELNSQLPDLESLLGTEDFDQVLVAVRPIGQLPESLRERIGRSMESMPDRLQAIDLEG